MIVDLSRARSAPVFGSLAVLLAALGLSFPAFAQNDDNDSEDDNSGMVEAPSEEITVTGSRLKRDTFTSISPLQVITTQSSRRARSVLSTRVRFCRNPLQQVVCRLT